MKISDELLQYCLEDRFRDYAISPSVADTILIMAKEIKECRDSARPKQAWPDLCHETHKSVRFSDSSSYDMVCRDCGATDYGSGSWGALRKPCIGD